MANYYWPELIEWMNFWDTWRQWARQKPSLKHPIKYIKWYFSEPKYKIICIPIEKGKKK